MLRALLAWVRACAFEAHAAFPKVFAYVSCILTALPVISAITWYFSSLPTFYPSAPPPPQPGPVIPERMSKVINLQSFSLYIQPGAASGFVRGSGRVASVHRVIWPINVKVALRFAKSPTNTSIPQVEIVISSTESVSLQLEGRQVRVCVVPPATLRGCV